MLKYLGNQRILLNYGQNLSSVIFKFRFNKNLLKKNSKIKAFGAGVNSQSTYSCILLSFVICLTGRCSTRRLNFKKSENIYSKIVQRTKQERLRPDILQIFVACLYKFIRRLCFLVTSLPVKYTSRKTFHKTLSFSRFMLHFQYPAKNRKQQDPFFYPRWWVVKNRNKTMQQSNLDKEKKAPGNRRWLATAQKYGFNS